MKKNSTNMSLAYHLAEALTAWTYAAGAKLETKTNLLGTIHGITSAMLHWLEEDKTSIEDLAEIEKDIQYLEDCYEPVIDQFPYAFEKKTAYKEYQRRVYSRLVVVISRHNLITTQIMKEVNALRWGEIKGGGLKE